MPSSPSEETKQNLLLHLQTNRNFVEQKIYKEFAVECLQQHELKTTDLNKMDECVRFIFDFGNNQEMKSFFTKLSLNMKKYIQNCEQKAKGDKVVMDLDNLIDMVVFCVENGFDKQEPAKAASKKQPKPVTPAKKKEKQPQPQKQPESQPSKPQITKLNPELESKVDKIKLVSKPVEAIKAPSKIQSRLDPSRIAKPSEFKIQKFEKLDFKTIVPKYLQAVTSSSPKKQAQPQIDYHAIYQTIQAENLKNKAFQKVMKERLFEIYRHYCSQLQNLGKSPTFSKMKNEMEKMNVGKFLLFCKNTVLFGKDEGSSKNTGKAFGKMQLSSQFKKIAEGRQEINFDEFEVLVKTLDRKFIKMHEENSKSVHSNSEENKSIPTYEARLFLHDGEKYKSCKRNTNMIFFTRDSHNYDNKLTVSDFDKKDLTAHSGRTPNQLKTHLKRNSLGSIGEYTTLESIDESRSDSPSLLSPLRDSLVKKPPKKISLQEISVQQWPKIEWLQQEVKNGEEGPDNQIFNKGRRKDVVKNLKKRVEQMNKKDSYKQNNDRYNY